MLPKSNLLSDVVLFFKQQLKDLYKEDEIEIFADYVFEEFCNLSRIDRIVKKDLRISESEVILVCNSIKKLQKNMPIQYVVNKAYFYGLPFYVDSSVLIPRPETEELVSWVNESVRVKEHGDILDIGTGSGCIAISLASMNDNCIVSAVDISQEVLAIARRNADNHHVNIHFKQSDALISESLPDKKFDIVVSNPPYVRQSEKGLMKLNVLDYEPNIALFVEDENPLVFYQSIVGYAINHLKKGGELFFEINEFFADEMGELLKTHCFEEVEIKYDFRGKPRFIKGINK